LSENVQGDDKRRKKVPQGTSITRKKTHKARSHPHIKIKEAVLEETALEEAVLEEKMKTAKSTPVAKINGTGSNATRNASP
jgi:hypothetical protein